MSCSKGNMKRTRPQKHQNRTAFKNDLHDKSVKTKFINSIQSHGICLRCKDIIDWKIKYKKYKPLAAPKKCVKCDQKSVKQAYHVMCQPCAKADGICAKCLKKEEVVEINQTTQAEEDELQNIIKALPERKRRTFLRYIRKQSEGSNKKKNKNKDDQENLSKEEDESRKLDLAEKINRLKLEAQQNKDIEDYDSDFIDSDCDEPFSDNDDDDDDDDEP